MPSAKALKILIVDDQTSMRGLLRYALQELGVKNVAEAKNGKEAAGMLSGNKFDLIISDWHMDEIDGLALLKMVRSHPLTKNTPFIMATAQKDKEQVMEAVKAGVNNYVVKPFNVNDLRTKIEQVIGKLA